MNIKINPNLDLKDDALRGFTTEQVLYIILGTVVAILCCLVLSLLDVPAAMYGIILMPVIFLIVSRGFKQKNGMSLTEIMAKKRRLRAKAAIYYKSTEGDRMDTVIKNERLSAQKKEKECRKRRDRLHGKKEKDKKKGEAAEGIQESF